MKESDKKRLKDAFNEAISKSPFADDPINGLAKEDGSPVTMRDVFTAQANSEAYFNLLDHVIESGEATLDQIVNQIKNTVKIELKK